MTRTRIRTRVPLTVSVVGSGSGSSSNPVGSSLTTEAFMLAITAPDTVPAPSEVMLFALRTTSADSNTTPTEGELFKIATGADSVTTPTGGHSTLVRQGATVVTQTSGTGWTNPSNAQGINDGVSATITGPSGLTPAAVTGSLTGTYVSPGSLSAETATGTVTLTFQFTLTIAALTGAGSFSVFASTDNGANYIAGQSFTQSTSQTSTITLTGLSATSLANVRFRVDASVTGSTIANSTATLDSVVASFSTTGAAG